MRGLFQDWAVEKHEETNHFYDKDRGVRYTLHLEMVAQVAKKFSYLWNKVMPSTMSTIADRNAIYNAAYGHDLMEDARQTYNDILEFLRLKCKCPEETAVATAEIILAVTNFPGRGRDERAPEQYYINIVSTPGATFIKLCDRIANIKYGLMVGGKMLQRYKTEMDKFRSKLFAEELREMFEYMEELLALEKKL